MRRPEDEQMTQEEIAELGAMLLAERPRPSEAFAAELDARVASRVVAPRPARVRAGRVPRRALLRWPRVPALAATALVAMVALVVVLQGQDGRGGSDSTPRSTAAAKRRTATSPSATARQRAATFGAFAGASDRAGEALSAPAPTTALSRLSSESLQVLPGARKVEQSATLTLGAPADRVEDVAQDVLATVAHADGIVDLSSVSRSGSRDASARFALRIPAARLQDTLAALSKLSHAHVLARSDDTVDVNQAYVSLRRRLAGAQAERSGLLRALAAATSEDETLRVKARLDAVEHTIARTERAQRGLDRQIDYSRVELTIDAEREGGGTAFSPRRGLHDAGRVLAVTAGVIVIAAAALVPLLVLLALGWPLARTLQRRRREQALDAG